MRLKRYLNSEVSLSTLAISFILMLIFLSQRFVRYLGYVVDGRLSSDALWTIVGLQIPALIGFLLPLSCFLGILIAFGRLYVDQELTAIKTLGVGDRQLVKLILPSILLLTLMAGLMSVFLSPWAMQRQHQLMEDSKKNAELRSLKPGRFELTSDKQGVILITGSSKKKTHLGQVFIAKRIAPSAYQTSGLSTETELTQIPQIFSSNAESQNNSESEQGIESTQNKTFWQIMTAKNGFYTIENEQPQLVLTQGYMYQIPITELNWQTSQFDRLQMKIPHQALSEKKQKIKMLSTVYLLQNLSPNHWAEIHWRISVPISLLLLSFLAVPFAKVRPRKGKFARLLPGILIYLCYAIGLLIGQSLIEKGQIPAQMGLWPLHIMMLFYVLKHYKHPKHKTFKSHITTPGSSV